LILILLRSTRKSIFPGPLFRFISLRHIPVPGYVARCLYNISMNLFLFFSFALSPKAAANVQPFFYPPSFFGKKLFFPLGRPISNRTYMNAVLPTPFPHTP